MHCPIYSEQHFASHFANRTLFRMRPVKGDSDVHVGRIGSLQEAMAKGERADDYLQGTDAVDLLTDEVSNLKSYRTNTSNGFADESNRALIYSKELQEEYGDLKVLNDGRSVEIYDTKGRSFMECDGLATASGGALLLNEGKMHFHVDDVDNLSGKLRPAKGPSAVEKLEKVIAFPMDYYSYPREIMAMIAGRAVVLVASSPSFSQEVERECQLAGVCMMSRSGTGFATAMPPRRQAPVGLPAQAQA